MPDTGRCSPRDVRSEPFEVLAAFARIDPPPRGRDGGRDGAAGIVRLASGAVLRGKGLQTIPASDRLVLMTPGGGCLGDLAGRAADLIAREIADGLVSAGTSQDIVRSATSRIDQVCPEDDPNV